MNVCSETTFVYLLQTGIVAGNGTKQMREQIINLESTFAKLATDVHRT